MKEVRGGRRKEEELFGSLTILLAWLCHGTELILPSLTDHAHTRAQTHKCAHTHRDGGRKSFS